MTRQPVKPPLTAELHVSRLCDFSRRAACATAHKKSGKNPKNWFFTTKKWASQNFLDTRIKRLNNQAGTFFNKRFIRKNAVGELVRRDDCIPWSLSFSRARGSF
jgi:hypothetical protein